MPTHETIRLWGNQMSSSSAHSGFHLPGRSNATKEASNTLSFSPTLGNTCSGNFFSTQATSTVVAIVEAELGSVAGTDKGTAAKGKGEDTAATATATFFLHQLHLLTDVSYP